jgi:hypothetical protein
VNVADIRQAAVVMAAFALEAATVEQKIPRPNRQGGTGRPAGGVATDAALCQFIEQEPGPRGSPQRPHAPACVPSNVFSPLPPDTAKTESSFCRSAPLHDGHVGDCPARVKYSKRRPQPRHSYSKRGMSYSTLA